MKKIDLIASLNHLSDKTIAEADAAREKKPARKNLPFMKIAALAACVVFVVFAAVYIGRNTELHIDRPDPVTTDPTVTDDPTVTPVVSDDLPKVLLPALDTGMGFEGEMAYDISEIISGSPWAEDVELTTLPIFKNGTYWYDHDIIGYYIPESVDIERMTDVMYEYAERFGLDTDTLEIVSTDVAVEWAPEDEENITRAFILAGLEVPDGAYQPQALEASQNGVNIRVIGEYAVNVSFDEPKAIPASLSTDFSDYYSVLSLAEYIKTEYGELTDFAVPTVSVGGGSRNIYGEHGYGMSLYDGAGDIAEQIVSYEFGRASFGFTDAGLSSIYFTDYNLENKIGDYPIISVGEATELLGRGKYLTTVLQYEMPGVEYVSMSELIYLNAKDSEYYVPFYRFYVYLPDAAAEPETGLKTYGIYYVPAILEKYVSGVMTTEYIHEADLPAYQNLGFYDGVFRDSKPEATRIETLEELMASSFENSLIDSFYKLRILGVVDEDDTVWLSGYDGLTDYNKSTFYRAVIEYDYFAGEDRNEEIIICLPSRTDMQTSDLPPYTEGDVIATMIYVTTPSSLDVARVFKSHAFIYDVYEIDGREYLFSRGQYVYKLENGLPNYLDSAYMKIVTSTTYNPVVYHGAYLPDDIAPALKNIIDEADRMPLQSLSNIIPGAIAHGGDGYPIYNGTNLVLTLESNPLYQNVDITAANPMTGMAMSYDDIAYDSFDNTTKVIAYQITGIYTYDEAVEKYGSFYDHNTLYRAHAFYDLVNDCAISYDFDVVGWGSVIKQDEGSPVYAVGDRYVSPLSEWDDGEYAISDSMLRFALHYVNGVKLAYHIGWENIRLEGKDYPNIDLEMTDSERKVVTTTANNPVIYTQKSSFDDLISFFRDDFWNRGYSKMPSGSVPQNLVVALSNNGDGFEGYKLMESTDELVDSNPWRALNITDGTTLPVYTSKLWIDAENEHTLMGIDYDYMRDQIEYWAELLNNFVEWVDLDISKAKFSDNAMDSKQRKETMSRFAEEGHPLPEEYGAATKITAEWNDVAISVSASENGYYETEIEFKNGIPLPDGMDDDIETYEKAVAQAEYLRLQFEWMMGHNDAANIEISGGDFGTGGKRNYSIALYHSFLHEEFVPIDSDKELPPIESDIEMPPVESMPASGQDEFDVIRTLINYNFNRFEFWGARYIRIRTLSDSYQRIGDYQIITPEQALERIDLGQFLTTSPDKSKTSADVEKIELIYREDGIPYYKCYVDISDYDYLAGKEYKTYAAYYVCAVAEEYLFGFEPELEETDPDSQPFLAYSADDLSAGPFDGFSYSELPVFYNLFGRATSYNKLLNLCYMFGLDWEVMIDEFDENAPQNSMSDNGVTATVDTATSVGTVTFDEPAELPEGYDFRSAADKNDLKSAAEYIYEQYADIFGFIKPRVAVVGGGCGEDGVRRYRVYVYDVNGDRIMRTKHYLFRSVELLPTEDGRLGGMVFAGDPIMEAIRLPVGGEWERLNKGQYLTLCGEFPGEEYVVSYEIVYKYANGGKYLIPYWRFVVENPNIPDYAAKKGMKEFWTYYVPAFEDVYMSSRYLEDMRALNGGFNN